jgi:hypothetical protein
MPTGYTVAHPRACQSTFTLAVLTRLTPGERDVLDALEELHAGPEVRVTLPHQPASVVGVPSAV